MGGHFRRLCYCVEALLRDGDKGLKNQLRDGDLTADEDFEDAKRIAMRFIERIEQGVTDMDLLESARKRRRLKRRMSGKG